MVRAQGKGIFALDGVCGLEMARTQRPQLILLDVEMQIMDGFIAKPVECDEMIAAIARYRPSVRISAP